MWWLFPLVADSEFVSGAHTYPKHLPTAAALLYEMRAAELYVGVSSSAAPALTPLRLTPAAMAAVEAG